MNENKDDGLLIVRTERESWGLFQKIISFLI